MFIDVAEKVEHDSAMVVQTVLVIVQSCCHFSKVEADGKIGIMFWGRILADVEITKQFFKLVLLVDVVVILKHREGESLAKTSRTDEEEVPIGLLYFFNKRSLVNIVIIFLDDIFKVLHAVRYAFAIDSLGSFCYCHILAVLICCGFLSCLGCQAFICRQSYKKIVEKQIFKVKNL